MIVPTAEPNTELNLAQVPREASRLGLFRYPAVHWVLVVILTVTGVFYVGVKGPKRSAFNRWRPVVQRLPAGNNIYLEANFPTPPVMGFILYPFSLPMPVVGMGLWFAFKAGLTVVTWQLLWRSHSLGTAAVPWHLQMIALFIVLLPIIGDLMHGNVNLWILFLLVLSFYFSTRNRDIGAGLALALAVCCKLTPALAVGYFLLARKFRVIASLLVGIGLFWFVLPSLIVGWDKNLELLTSWSKQMISPYVVEGRVTTDEINQSLPAVVARLIQPDRWSEFLNDKELTLRSLDRPWVLWATKGATAGVALALSLLCWVGIRNNKASHHAFASTLLGMLLLSERSWKHHYVLMLPAIVFLARELAGTSQLSMARRRFIAIGMSVSATLLWASSQDLVDPILGKGACESIQFAGSYVAAVFVLLFCQLVVFTAPARRTHLSPSLRLHSSAEQCDKKVWLPFGSRASESVTGLEIRA